MICADCGADIIVTDPPGRKAAEPLCIETEHVCPAGILDEDVWLSGVTVFEASRIRKEE